MAKPAVDVQGGRELRRKFKEAGDDMADLKELHRRLADDVAGTAKTKVPVRTGRLRNSIRGSGTKTAARVRVGNNRKSGPSAVPYAKPIHFGWAAKNIKPQPFIFEALDERRQDVINAYNDQVRQIIRQVF
tara:strand:- start:427 stop:819 length:393 start_codon:yes stop_codon:yes gene_type:complete